MRRAYYILRGHEPVEVATTLEWGRFMEQSELRIVAQDRVGRYLVSTVFLGMDHNWGEGPPLFFETMVFTNTEGNDCWRFSTWEQAEEWHHAVVRRLIRKENPDGQLDGEGVSSGTS